ncbi:hypothetical protein [Phenylobacterium aquaticum]|uniref:hypothetical protein n=1 Tax=Phenylobacterium aquaticum TaxID=1763816 RepID=UPI0026F01229|nr:hypothetical protein [Phenylobacterium aquaticum]
MSGWLIGVLVELPGEPAPIRHYYGVGFEDRAKSEWMALDAGQLIGRIASSPYKGQEPVQMLGHLTPVRMKTLGLKPGEVRALGPNWPRRWIEVTSPPQ